MSSHLNEQIFLFANKLKAAHGDDDYYLALVDKAPLLFKIVGGAPPAFMVKFRMKAPFYLQSSWPTTLPPELQRAKISCDAEGEYLHLWVQDCSTLDAGQLEFLLRDCIANHAEHFPEDEPYCFLCKRDRSTTLVQAEDSVSAVCKLCLEEKKSELERSTEKSNQTTTALSAFLPVGIGIGALGWAAFWLLYNALFSALKTDHLWLPKPLALAIVMMVVLGLGWPIGKLLHRSGATRLLPAKGLAAATAFSTVVLGEILFTAYLTYDYTGQANPGIVLHNTIQIALDGGANYILTKLLFALPLAASIYMTSTPKTGALKI